MSNLRLFLVGEKICHRKQLTQTLLFLSAVSHGEISTFVSGNPKISIVFVGSQLRFVWSRIVRFRSFKASGELSCVQTFPFLVAKKETYMYILLGGEDITHCCNCIKFCTI